DHAGAEDAGCAAALLRSLRSGCWGDWRGRNVSHLLKPHTGKVHSAQKGAGAKLAWPRDIHQKLHEDVAQLSKFARKLIGRGSLFGIRLARKQHDPLIA